MRRVDPRTSARLRNVIAKRFRRKVRSRRRAEELRRRGQHYSEATRPLASRAGSFRVEAPKQLSLFDAYEPTIGFLQAVRRVALRDGNRVVLDLRKVEKISPDVCPLLLAEVQRIRWAKGSEMITGLSPRSKAARRRLHAMGFFEKLGMYDLFSLEEGDDLESEFSIESGIKMDGAIPKQMADQFAEAMSLTSDQAETIQKALNEALENISEHAYYDPTRIKWKAEPGRWWICTLHSKAKQGAFVLACDLGMTIPLTIEETAKKKGPENVAALAKYVANHLTLSPDERYLGAAFEDGVTRRPEQKGGRGLGKMAALVSDFPTGQLHVLSGGAMASLFQSGDGIRLQKLPRAFHGTYILWHLAQEPLK